MADGDAIAEWKTAAYVMWEARTKLVFEGRVFFCDEAVKRAMELLKQPPTA